MYACFQVPEKIIRKSAVVQHSIVASPMLASGEAAERARGVLQATQGKPRNPEHPTDLRFADQRQGPRYPRPPLWVADDHDRSSRPSFTSVPAGVYVLNSAFPLDHDGHVAWVFACGFVFQDYDGSHIKGLLINMLHHYWPQLLHCNHFLTEFVTPIVKARLFSPSQLGHCC